MFRWLKWLKYVKVLQAIGAAADELRDLPEDWTDRESVTAWLHEAEAEIVVAINQVAEVIEEVRPESDEDDEDEPLVVGRVRAAIANARK